MITLWPWISFNAAVLAALAIDLGLFNRASRTPSTRHAALLSGAWITLALAFAAGIFFVKGTQSGTEFLTGYLIEYSLSVDNIFVFVLIFSYFSIPSAYQYRILFWGIVGALLMRGVMIVAGTALLHQFHWMIYLFGAFLLITGIRMALGGESSIDPNKNPVLILVRRMVPVCTSYRGKSFFLRTPDARGIVRTMATPLFVALIVVETMDIIFAIDSIPAVLAVTRDPFIVYTSNVCAILGLRSLYVVLAGVIDRVRYLRVGLAVILVFVGAKMLLASWYTIPIVTSLGVIAMILSVTVAVSLILSREHAPPSPR